MKGQVNRAAAVLFFCLFMAPLPLCAGRSLTFSTIEGAHFGAPIIEVLTRAYRRLGYTITLEKMSAQRALIDAGQGLYDGELFRTSLVDHMYPDLIMVDVPCYEVDVRIYLPQEKRFPVSGWESLPKGYTLVSPFGIKYTDRIIRDNSLTATFVKTPEDAVGFVLSGKADFTFSTANMDEFIRARHLEDKLVRLDPPVDRVKIFHYLHKKNADLVPLIRDVLKAMHEDGTIAGIVPPWGKTP